VVLPGLRKLAKKAIKRRDQALLRPDLPMLIFEAGQADSAFKDACEPDVILDLIEDVEETNAIFELLWQRMSEAIEVWQSANPGNDLVHPDTGRLVHWLVTERERGNVSTQARVKDFELAAIDAHAGWMLYESCHGLVSINHTREWLDCEADVCVQRRAVISG